MRQNNREKGKRGERLFKNLLSKFFPEIRRNAGTQSQSGGVDLENTGNFDFEVKNGKTYTLTKIRAMLDQVEEEGKEDHYKVVLVKPDREEPYALMPYSTFEKILEELLS